MCARCKKLLDEMLRWQRVDNKSLFGLVCNGNDSPYTKNPTTHALVWSLIGMFIWIPILVLLMLPFFFV